MPAFYETENTIRISEQWRFRQILKYKVMQTNGHLSGRNTGPERSTVISRL